MSNPRRGLLAAGLTAAVVGSLGVVWTFNADAAETAPAEIPAAVETDAEPVPPPLLPWGDEPEPLKLAKPDANSAAVAAAGADAATADTSGSQVAGPKGGDFDVPGEAPVPPVPPTAGVTTAKAAAEQVYFHYAAADLTGETDGTWASMTIERPVLNTGDKHSLAEIAVRSGDAGHKQTVEVGWTVDRSLNKDNDPHLFVYHWVDGKETCYNVCGFVPYSAATIKPGATLPVSDVPKRFGIQHSADGFWWIAYDSAWIGYFPDTIWGGRFTKGGFTQWFGEVASPLQLPCSDMGNGKLAAAEVGARIANISMVNGPEVKPEFWVSNPDAKSYAIAVQPEKTVRSFRYGGPGASGCPD